MSKKRLFSYPKYFKFVNPIVSLLIIYMSGLIIFLQYNQFSTTIAEAGYDLGNISIFLSWLLLVITISSAVINFWQEFTVLDKGIEFQTFIFWRIFVPWNEIYSIKQSYIPWEKYQVIKLKRLTPLHRLIGMVYGLTLNPVFIFNQQIRNYEKAITLIKKKLEQN